MLTNIISLTDAWGVAHGGINSFNTDFCKALGRGHPSDYRLTCVVRSASQEDITDAKIHGVHLVSSDPDQTEKGLSVEGILGALTAQGRRPDKNDVIIGHDIISGEVACAVAKQTGARSAVIRHMIYQAYHTEKSGKAESTNAKHNEQRQLFKQCDLAFAVGPYMADHTQNFFALEDTRTVVTLIAGLEDIEVNHKPKVSFNGITFGRINAQDDIIKQGILAVTAFAKAVHSYAEMTSASVQSTFHLYGLSDTEKEKQQELDKIKSAVKSQTKGWINIVPAPYTLNRNQLIQDLQEKHVCLMLSIHEGFGLVGWEAIAAGVPLVVSENSGLYKYLHQLGLQENVAHIHLGFNNDDKSPSADNIEAVAQCVRSIKADWENWQKRAINLRTALKNQHNCSWESTAETFLDGCNIQREHTRTALLDAPSLGPLNGPLEAWLSKDTEPVLALGGEDTTSAPLQHWLTMWCRRASRLLIPISLTDPESDPRDLLLNALAPSRERSSIGLSESV
ncbi:MAG: glycosyltransferase family 4 protein, partial [Rhodospirillaceae bacterium]